MLPISKIRSTLKYTRVCSRIHACFLNLYGHGFLLMSRSCVGWPCETVFIFRWIVPTVTQNSNMLVVYSHDTGVWARDFLFKRCGLVYWLQVMYLELVLWWGTAHTALLNLTLVVSYMNGSTFLSLSRCKSSEKLLHVKFASSSRFIRLPSHLVSVAGFA